MARLHPFWGDLGRDAGRRMLQLRVIAGQPPVGVEQVGALGVALVKPRPIDGRQHPQARDAVTDGDLVRGLPLPLVPQRRLHWNASIAQPALDGVEPFTIDGTAAQVL